MGTPELAYIELRDYSINPYTGERFEFSEPCIVYPNHVQFLETVLERVNRDGSVSMGEWTTVPIEEADISGLTPYDRDELRYHLAQALFSAVRTIATFRHDREQVMSHERFVAQLIARYRHEPEVLRDAAMIADKATEQWKPSVI